jgi:TonB family protein
MLVPLLAARAAAQHVLMAENNGQLSWVRAVSGTTPCVEIDGKIEPVGESHGCVLRAVPEYLPMFVSIRNIAVRGSAVSDGGSSMDNTFYLDATLECGCPLDNVFLVLELDQPIDKSVFLAEVGHLDANTEKQVSAIVVSAVRLTSGSYHLHLFSGGAEVLQSEIPYNVREAAFDRLVADRIKDVHAAAPKLLFCPAPVYPSVLTKANIKGKAVIAIRIGTNGAVHDPVVRSATDPAFGDAALEAIRVWRFLPTVKDDAAVETKVLVPFIFDPPKAT